MPMLLFVYAYIILCDVSSASPPGSGAQPIQPSGPATGGGGLTSPPPYCPPESQVQQPGMPKGGIPANTDAARQAFAGQTATLLSAAATQLHTGDSINDIAPGNKPLDMKTLQDYVCNAKTMDGNPALQQLKEQQRQKCLEEAKAQKEAAQKLIEKAARQKDECVIKVNTKSLLCQMKDQLLDILSKPYIRILREGNLIDVEVGGRIVLLIVKEWLTYSKTPISKPKEPIMDLTEGEITANSLGQITCVKGTWPAKDQRKNSCYECLDYLSQMRSSNEGRPDECEATCEDDIGGMQELYAQNFFKTKAPEPKPAPAKGHK